MTIHFYQNADAFLGDTTDFLQQQEAINNLVLGLACSLKGQSDFEPKEQAVLLSIKEEQALTGAALMTPGRNLNLYIPSHENQASHLPDLIQALSAKGIKLPGINALAPVAEAFAKTWCHLHQLSPRLTMHNTVYQLDQVHSIRPCPGTFRPANIGDILTLHSWMLAFGKEAMGIPNEQDVMQNTLNKFKKEELFVWEDNGLACMAAASRPTPNGITINYVYTPPEKRGHGYASNCVAALSQKMLDQGYKFCALFADKKNPTSNRIYQDMGYRPLADFSSIEFIVLQGEICES